MSRTQLIKIIRSQKYFLPNKKKHLRRVYVWIYPGDSLYSSEDWIDLDQDTTKWRAVLSREMNVIFKKYGNLLD